MIGLPVAATPALAELEGFAPLMDAAASERLWRVGICYLTLLAVGVCIDLWLAARVWVGPVRWRPREQRLARRPWTAQDAAQLLIWLLAWYAGAIFLRLVWQGERSPRALWIIVHGLVFNLGGLLFIALSLEQRGISWRSAFGIETRAWPARVGTAALFYLAALPFLWFYTLLYQAGLTAAGYKPQWQEVAWVFASEPSAVIRALLIFLAVGIAPVFEEALFRGIALPLLARRWGTARAIVAVSAFFAALHFHLPSLVPLFIIAAAFSLGYIFTGNLLVPVAMHALFNGVNLFLLSMLQ